MAKRGEQAKENKEKSQKQVERMIGGIGERLQELEAKNKDVTKLKEQLTAILLEFKNLNIDKRSYQKQIDKLFDRAVDLAVEIDNLKREDETVKRTIAKKEGKIVEGGYTKKDSVRRKVAEERIAEGTAPEKEITEKEQVEPEEPKPAEPVEVSPQKRKSLREIILDLENKAEELNAKSEGNTGESLLKRIETMKELIEQIHDQTGAEKKQTMRLFVAQKEECLGLIKLLSSKDQRRGEFLSVLNARPEKVVDRQKEILMDKIKGIKDDLAWLKTGFENLSGRAKEFYDAQLSNLVLDNIEWVEKELEKIEQGKIAKQKIDEVLKNIKKEVASLVTYLDKLQKYTNPLTEEPIVQTEPVETVPAPEPEPTPAPAPEPTPAPTPAEPPEEERIGDEWAEQPEPPMEVEDIEEVPERKKGFLGWIKEKLGRTKEVAKDYGPEVANAAYKVISKVLGVKFYTDALLALRKKGDLYEHIKGAEGTKEEKRAIKSVLEEIIAKIEAERAAAPANQPEAEPAQPEESPELVAKVRELEEKINSAEYISGGEKRDLHRRLLEIARKREDATEVAKVKREKKIQEVLAAYVVNKVSGWKIASDALDLAITPIAFLRAGVYAGLAVAERMQKARRKFKKEKDFSEKGEGRFIAKDLIVNATRETLRGLAGMGIEKKENITGKERVQGVLKALGTLARGFGIFGVAFTAGDGVQKSIDHLLDNISKQGLAAGWSNGMVENAERMIQVYAHPVDTAHKAFDNTAGRGLRALGINTGAPTTGEALNFKLKNPIIEGGAKAALVAGPELIETEAVEVTAKGPSQAAHKLEDFFKSQKVKWGHTEIVNEMKRHGYVFHKDGSVSHPVMFHKGGGKLVPWIDEEGKGHFEIEGAKKQYWHEETYKPKAELAHEESSVKTESVKVESGLLTGKQQSMLTNYSDVQRGIIKNQTDLAVRLKHIEPYYDRLAELGKEGLGKSAEAQQLKNVIIGLSKDTYNKVSFEQYINWPEGVAYHQTGAAKAAVGEINLRPRAAAQVLEPDWNTKPTMRTSGKVGGDKATEIREPDWGLKGKQVATGGKVRGGGVHPIEVTKKSIAPVPETKPEAKLKVTEMPIAPESEIVTNNVRHLHTEWDKVFIDFYQDDKAGIMDGLLHKLENSMWAHPEMQGEINSVLQNKSLNSMQRISEVVDLITNGGEGLTVEEKLLLGGDYTEDNDFMRITGHNFDVVFSKDHSKAAALIFKDQALIDVYGEYKFLSSKNVIDPKEFIKNWEKVATET
ncbi:MAG: hypothetical protein WC526_02460 [Patescibacteria group bacterium]